MKHLLYLSIALLLSSCMSVEKATSYLERKGVDAKYCYERFPIKETVITDTLITEKQIVIPGDSIPCPETVNPTTGKKYTPKVKCPDVAYLERTITAKEKRIQEATSGIEMYKTKYLQEKEAHEKSKAEKAELAAQLQKMRKYKWICFIFAGLITLRLLWPVIAPILKRLLPV